MSVPVNTTPGQTVTLVMDAQQAIPGSVDWYINLFNAAGSYTNIINAPNPNPLTGTGSSGGWTVTGFDAGANSITLTIPPNAPSGSYNIEFGPNGTRGSAVFTVASAPPAATVVPILTATGQIVGGKPSILLQGQ